MNALLRNLEEQFSGTRLLLLPLLLLTMFLVGIAVVLADEWLKWSGWEFIALTLLAVLIFAPLLLDLFSKERIDIFKPFYMMALIFFIAFLASPIIMLVEGWVGVRNNDFREQLAKATFVATVGLLGFYVGYLVLQSHSRSPKRLHANTVLGWQIDHKKAFPLALLGFFISVALFYLWVRMEGIAVAQLNVLEESVVYGQQGSATSGGTLYMFSFRLSWTLLVLMVYYLAPSRFWKGFSVLMWLSVLAVYVMAGNRSNLLIFLTSTIMAYFLRIDRRPRLPFLAVILAAFVVASGFLVSARGRGGIPNEIAYLNEFATEITDRGAATGLMGAVQVFPEKSRYLGLVAFSDLIYAPIPRALWPQKPSLRPVQDVLNRYLPSRSHAPGVMGVFYAASGFAGPFIILCFYGILSAYIFENWRENKSHLVSQLLLAGWVPFLWVLIHRGVLSKHIVEMLYRFGPVLLIYFAARVPAARPENVKAETSAMTIK